MDRYCKPNNAGLASETPAVCRRIGRLITALDTEINAYIVEGKILSDLFAFRNVLLKRLEAEGWTFSYDGGNRMKVRQPGHARPFNRRQIKEHSGRPLSAVDVVSPENQQRLKRLKEDQ